jgi:hypothetical protein
MDLVSIFKEMFIYLPFSLPIFNGNNHTLPTAFSIYDFISHLGPQSAGQLIEGASGYNHLMERAAVTPHIVGYTRYYQLYDLAYSHPRMKY